MAEFNCLTLNDVNYVEIEMNNETVRTEAGAMRYYQGDIEMESKAPGIGGIFKAAATGESIMKPTYTGTGKLVLEPALHDFYPLELDGSTALILDRGAYWCSDAGVEVEASMNKLGAGLLSGEGLVQTKVSGNGTVVIAAPGPLEAVDLNDEKLVVDGTFAVARTESLNFTVQKSSKSLIGSFTSGEGLVNVFEGTGRVFLAPIPNKNVVLGDVVTSAVMSIPRGG